MARVLIAGCGEIGSTLGKKLVAQGHMVWGIRRQTRHLAQEIQAIQADLTERMGLELIPRNIDFVFYTAAASEYNDHTYYQTYVQGLNNLLGLLRKQEQTPKRIFFISSTSVYHQSDSEWVDEESTTQPSTFPGKRMLEAEDLLLQSYFSFTIVRLAGIYGPNYSRLLDELKAGSSLLSPTPLYTNRIHQDDCVDLLMHLMKSEQLFPCYIGADCVPAQKNEVIAWLCEQLGIPLPKTGPNVLHPQRGNKRCSNARLLASGYRFKYPSFREGYRTLIADSV